MRSVAIEGLDGSGKTTVAQELARVYEAEGKTTRVVSPYRLANEEIGHDLYHLWKSTNGGLLAVEALKKVIDAKKEEAEADDVDVLIYDRHWMTAFTEIAANSELVAAWGDCFVPTAYLRVDPDTARKRATNDQDKTWMNRHNFDNYATRYDMLCQNFGQNLLGIYRNDDDVSANAIARSIVWDMNILR